MLLRMTSRNFRLAVAFLVLLTGQSRGPCAGASEFTPLNMLLAGTGSAAIRAEGRIVRAVSGEGALLLHIAPLVPASAELRAAIAAEEPSILVEAVFLLERPVPADPLAELASAYGILRSISSLQGILYWSASRKTWRTFYEESWRIADPETRSKVADSEAGSSAPDVTVYAWQKDLSFGGNVYRYRYRLYGMGTAAQAHEVPAGPACIFVESSNLTRMSYGIIPAMGPEGLKTRLIVVPCAEGILFYAVSAARAPGIPGLRGKLEDSFTNRAEALFRWFGDRFRASR